MKTCRFPLAGLAIAGALLLGACDNGSDGPVVVPPTPAPPPPQAQSFTGFVTDQFANTADDTDPEQVDGTDFAFDDDENPDAFDALLDSI